MAYIPFVFPHAAALGNTITLPSNSKSHGQFVEKSDVKNIFSEKSGQKIPKETIYKQANPTPDIKRIFIQQVDQIIWRYKLSADTLNISTSDNISEVQVFDIILKPECEAINELVLSTLDKTILTSIYFRLFYTNTHRMKMQCAMADKRVNKRSDEQMVVRDYFISPKIDIQFNLELNLPYMSESQKLPVVIDMTGLHKELLRSLLEQPALNDETLEEQLDRIATLKKLNNNSAKIQSAISKEKQFNRKVQLNKMLNQIKKQIKALSG
ncbi:DUF4391 domain-containing protein [Psychromonas ingrahamii]|nr:DUF4391 domain-containing protein [Psychromonas ingrahamii]